MFLSDGAISSHGAIPLTAQIGQKIRDRPDIAPRWESDLTNDARELLLSK